VSVDKELGFSPREPEVLVTFVFDDGYATDYTVMKPVFDAQGEVACSAIITDKLNTGSYMTNAQVQALHTAGWEILSHTKTGTSLDTLTEEQVRTEFSTSNSVLEGLGFEVNSLVYPQNDHNEMVRRVAREYYRSGRGTVGINPRILETHQLKSVPADDHTELATYQTYVDLAETRKVWLIFNLHNTTSDDATAMGTLIDYIQAKSISIVTFNQALDLIGNMSDAGDNYSINTRGLRAEYIQGPTGFDVATPYAPVHIGGMDQIGGRDYSLLLRSDETTEAMRFAFNGNNAGDYSNAVLMGETTNGTGDFAVYTASDADFTAGTATWALRFLVSQLGKVSINTTAAAKQVSIGTTANAITGTSVDISNLTLDLHNPADDNGEALGIGFGLSTTLTNVGAAIIHERSGVASSGHLHFATKSSGVGSVDIPIRVTITKDGDVGIGEVLPETLLELTHATPIITTHCNTHANTAGSGASKWIGKREDGAGTETAAGQIEISHDGAVANDQLGKIIASVNTGAGLAQALEIGSDLLATFAGVVNAVGGFSDNGTAGIDTTFLDADGNTITVLGGIITAKTAP